MTRTIILIILLFTGFKMNAQDGIHFGGGFMYNTDSLMRAMGIQAKLSGSISDRFVLHGAGTYFFRKETYYSIDADLHYRFINLNEVFTINPFAGINLTRTTKTNTSLNVGLSLMLFRDNYHFYFEPKFIVDDSQFLMSLGIMI